MGRLSRKFRRQAERENAIIFAPERRREAWLYLRAHRMERSLTGPIERFTPLHRDEVSEVLAHREGYLFREIKHVQSPAVQWLPRTARFVKRVSSGEFEGWSDKPEMHDEYVFVFETEPDKKGKSQLLRVDSDWGQPGDRIACGERFHVTGQQVEYEADFDSGERPRTGYWKAAKNLARSRVRLVLEIADVQPIRIHDAAVELESAQQTQYKNGALQSIWIRKYGRESWDQNAWAWRIKYRQL